MGEKRIIEHEASDEIFNDDWLLKDSVLNGTKKVQPSVIKEYVNQGMATATALANEATARANADTALGGRIDKALANEAETYNPSKTYVNGDYCIHEDNLYICNASTGTSGQWNSSKWTQIAVGSELKSLWTDLTSERTARQQADTALGQRIDDLNFSADAISYDNTSSGLEAENVQDAIGETITKLSAVGSASGDIATFTDGSDLPMPKLEVAIEPVQEGSGDPSPENIRPIIGWDEVNVGVVGKNLLSLAMFDSNSYFTINGDGSVTQLQNDGRSESAMPKLFLKKGTYTFSRSQAVGLYYIYSMHDGVITWYIQNGSGTSRTFTLDNDDELYIKVSVGGTSGSYPFTAFFMIEKGDEATTFEKFNGQTITLDLDGTRYGGKVDLVSGVMTVDRAIKTVADCYWYGSNGFFYTGTVINEIVHDDGRYDHCISDAYTTKNVAQSSSLANGEMSVAPSGYIQLKDARYSSTTELRTNMGTTQLVYELATPITIQLTPTVVKSLRGVNNVWADTGAILDAEYIRDLTTIIDYILEQLGN